jgi:NH3-dependent NAD+ synthetase
MRGGLSGGVTCTTGGTVVTGAGGADFGGSEAGACLAMSSGRTITAMKATASPTIAEADMKVMNRMKGRVDMSRIFLIGRRLKP